jgi:hypothetical protein
LAVHGRADVPIESRDIGAERERDRAFALFARSQLEGSPLQNVDDSTDEVEQMRAERDSARALADQLAAALRILRDDPHDAYPSAVALVAYEARDWE